MSGGDCVGAVKTTFKSHSLSLWRSLHSDFQRSSTCCLCPNISCYIKAIMYLNFLYTAMAQVYFYFYLFKLYFLGNWFSSALLFRHWGGDSAVMQGLALSPNSENIMGWNVLRRSCGVCVFSLCNSEMDKWKKWMDGNWVGHFPQKLRNTIPPPSFLSKFPFINRQWSGQLSPEQPSIYHRPPHIFINYSTAWEPCRILSVCHWWIKEQIDHLCFCLSFAYK